MPYIGGQENMFSEWLIYGVFYLAVYQVLDTQGLRIEEAGKVIFDTFYTLADYPICEQRYLDASGLLFLAGLRGLFDFLTDVF